MTAHPVRYRSSARPRQLRELHRIKSVRDTVGAFLALAVAFGIVLGAGALGWLMLHATQH